ncbi:hypothetical protein ACF0H5_021853 [Mactra antiquata]
MSVGIQSRRISAVVGALVADAAAQPIHWNYKVDKLDDMLKDADDVAFWEPSSNPFYKLPTGSQSCYGDQSFVILKSLVENKGLDISQLNKLTYDWFGPNSGYENPTNALYKEKKDAEQKTIFPIDGPWRHFSIKDFLRNVVEGKDETGSETDKQIDCCLRIVPVVSLFAGQPDMLDKAELVIRSTQNSDTCVAIGLAAARLLEFYILNGALPDAVESVIKDLSNPKRVNPQDLDVAVIGFLREVTRVKDKPHIQILPGSFQSAVHGVVSSTDYQTGVQATLRAGGCNASRAGFIGACLAAQHGLSSIPDTWKQKTTKYQEIVKLAEQLVEFNSVL